MTTYIHIKGSNVTVSHLWKAHIYVIHVCACVCVFVCMCVYVYVCMYVGWTSFIIIVVLILYPTLLVLCS